MNSGEGEHMQNQSDQNLDLYRELVKEKDLVEKQNTVKAYGFLAMLYMYLGE
ncbi:MULTISPECIES: hypothetical protein [Lentilactobacillus]|jgi:hypothetical protein|uniref:hypothetical protein n=1 Tax=Lentilactobacillus hilgardii TaxID=1588 RepID=UPI00019C683B|nr:hypothetical protein HMPREF0497_2145 [Lentilactobacillus buchneri ATCC 11577]